MGCTSQLSLGGEVLRHDMHERGYNELQHGIPSDQIDHLVETYASFTLNHPDPLPSTMDAMLPDSPLHQLKKQLDELDRSQDTQDEWHKFRTNTPGIGKPNGYSSRSAQIAVLRRARGIDLFDEEPKEFYHYTPHHYADVTRAHKDYGWSDPPIEVRQLNNAFAPIHKRASELIMKIAGLIEETHPEARNIFDVESLRNSPVRLVFYPPHTSDLLGAGHYDKSTLTIQIAESHEGLRVAPNKDTPLQLVRRDADSAVIFPGTDLANKLDDNTVYQPGWHDIIRLNTPNKGRGMPIRAIEVCARWALIFFANGSNFVNPDKLLTHTR